MITTATSMPCAAISWMIRFRQIHDLAISDAFPAPAARRTQEQRGIAAKTPRPMLCSLKYKDGSWGMRPHMPPLFPAFFELPVQEMHLKWQVVNLPKSRSSHEIAAQGIDVASGIIDVKSYYVETPGDVAGRVRFVPEHAPAERLSFAPDCGLSQTARWRRGRNSITMVSGVAIVGRNWDWRDPPIRSHDALLADNPRIRQARRQFSLVVAGAERIPACNGREFHVLLDPYLSDSLTKNTARR